MSEVLITRLEVRPDQVERALRVFADMQADVHANEPGTVAYQYYRGVEQPNLFFVHEVFIDQAAKEFHLGRHGQRRADFDEILAVAPIFHAVRPIP